MKNPDLLGEIPRSPELPSSTASRSRGAENGTTFQAICSHVHLTATVALSQLWRHRNVKKSPGTARVWEVLVEGLHHEKCWLNLNHQKWEIETTIIRWYSWVYLNCPPSIRICLSNKEFHSIVTIPNVSLVQYIVQTTTIIDQPSSIELCLGSFCATLGLSHHQNQNPTMDPS